MMLPLENQCTRQVFDMDLITCAWRRKKGSLWHLHHSQIFRSHRIALLTLVIYERRCLASLIVVAISFDLQVPLMFSTFPISDFE